MNRCFKVNPQNYEQTRLSLDQATGLALHETVYEPLATAPIAPDGNALISIRAEHCDMEPYANAIASLLLASVAIEITQAEYEAALPAPVLPIGGQE